jgi:hypothetical protein
MDGVETAAGGATGWVMQQVRAALGLVDNSLAPVLTPDQTNARQRRESDEEKERRAASER